MQAFDAIVIGVGGMGAAALSELARRGKRVLGLEQFAVGHDRGSSHGHTRIIRRAYYEHPAYVPLVERSFAGWYALEQRRGRHLVTESPCLSIGTPESQLLQGVLASSAEHSLPVERLPYAALRRRYPAFQFGPQFEGVVERTAGILYVDDCVRAFVQDALDHGAALRDQEPVLDVRADGSHFQVRTAAGTYQARSVVLTAGPWLGQLLGEHAGFLRVMRQVMTWWGVTDPAAFRRDRFPIFIADTPEGYFYGLPMLDPRGVKVARHYGAPELLHPDQVNRLVSDEDMAAVRGFVGRHLPAADTARCVHSVCLYTLTPDRHFLIDRHPQLPGLFFAGGFSGHGFKFAPVVGEILADLVTTGATPWPLDMFRLGRFTPA